MESAQKGRIPEEVMAVFHARGDGGGGSSHSRSCTAEF